MKELPDKCKRCEYIKKINEIKYYCMFGKCIKEKEVIHTVKEDHSMAQNRQTEKIVK